MDRDETDSQSAPPDPRGRYDRALPPGVRSLEQRGRLLQSCAARLAAGEELTVASVTSRAGLGRNALYLHFGDVPDLVDAFIHECAVAVTARLGAALAEEPTPRTALTACGQAWLAWASEHPEHGRALTSLPRRRVDLVRHALRRALEECVRRGQGDGLFAGAAEPVAMAVVLGGLLELGAQCAEGDARAAAAAPVWAQSAVHTFAGRR